MLHRRNKTAYLFTRRTTRFTDHLYPPRSVLADRDAGWTKWVARAILVAVVAMIVLIAGGVQEEAATCLTSDGAGHCAER